MGPAQQPAAIREVAWQAMQMPGYYTGLAVQALDVRPTVTSNRALYIQMTSGRLLKFDAGSWGYTEPHMVRDFEAGRRGSSTAPLASRDPLMFRRGFMVPAAAVLDDELHVGLVGKLMIVDERIHADLDEGVSLETGLSPVDTFDRRYRSCELAGVYVPFRGDLALVGQETFGDGGWIPLTAGQRTPKMIVFDTVTGGQFGVAIDKARNNAHLVSVLTGEVLVSWKPEPGDVLSTNQPLLVDGVAVTDEISSAVGVTGAWKLDVVLTSAYANSPKTQAFAGLDTTRGPAFDLRGLTD